MLYEHSDASLVASGFGGVVCACRLAASGPGTAPNAALSSRGAEDISGNAQVSGLCKSQRSA